MPVPFSPTIAVMPSLAGVNALSVMPRKDFKDAVISFIHTIVRSGQQRCQNLAKRRTAVGRGYRNTPPTWQEVSARSQYGGSYLRSKRPRGGAFPESNSPGNRVAVEPLSDYFSFLNKKTIVQNNSMALADDAVRQPEKRRTRPRSHTRPAVNGDCSPHHHEDTKRRSARPTKRKRAPRHNSARAGVRRFTSQA